ncbi:MAG: PilZ domain-containing protein [Pirellulaceae bacterium]|nr:PilZ domain-containing protein [Pirellulaceae bacterium]
MKSQVDFPPLKVVLPQELRSFYAERGYLSSKPHEDRRYARLNVRTHAHIRFFPPPALLEVGPVASDHQQGTVLVKDLSKTGIAILYHRQIFPGERFDVLLHGRAIDATAVRCRRVGRLCYETGAVVNSVTVEPESDSLHH